MVSVYKEKIALWDWYEAECVSSTNDEIRQLVPQCGKYIAISAKRQTGGRGRRGHIWREGEGNLYFTFSMELNVEELSRFVCLVGLSLAETLLEKSPQSDVKIKWPNDVFISGKKISGILIEKIDNGLWAIGIGVNIAVAPEIANVEYKTGSLYESGIMLDRIEFLRYYLAKFASVMERYQTEGFKPLKEQWLGLALNYRQQICIKTEKNVKNGEFAALDDNGYLMLRTDSGMERIVAGDLFV